MSTNARRRLGSDGELLAVEHLARQGFRIVERNYRTRWGELDIVAFDGRTLVFCEVKTRRTGGSCGGPFEALGPAKQGQVRRIAASWLNQRRERPYAAVLRFDAIGIMLDPAGRLVCLEHLEGAF